jgi:hypothetical protein
MKVELGEGLFIVQWKHRKLTKAEESVHCNKNTITHITECDIFDERYILIGHGVSLCSSVDQFKKSTGRKISLTRALNDANFSREQRTEFWDRYIWQNGCRI